MAVKLNSALLKLKEKIVIIKFCFAFGKCEVVIELKRKKTPT